MMSVKKWKLKKGLICSLHFEPFTNGSQLDPFAVPSVFPWSPEWNDRLLTSLDHLARRNGHSTEESEIGKVSLLRKEPNKFTKEEEELKRQLEQLDREISAGYQLMDNVRNSESLRMDALRKKIASAELRESQCLSKIADLETKKKGLDSQLLRLIVRKLGVSIAIHSMTKGHSTVPPVKEEEIDPVFARHLKTKLPILERSICLAQAEEETLVTSIKVSQESLDSVRRQLAVFRKDLVHSGNSADSLYSLRLKQLMNEQQERLQTYGFIEIEMVEVGQKRRLSKLDEYKTDSFF